MENPDNFSLFASDAFLPSQYRDARRQASPYAAEKDLVLAVLLEAIECLQYRAPALAGNHGSAYRQALHDEALQWITSDWDDDWAFSFTNVCDALSLDADVIRARLLAGPVRSSTRRNPAAPNNGCIEASPQRKRKSSPYDSKWQAQP
jgi:hypothetical protein